MKINKLKSYTTSIGVNQTVVSIHTMLAKTGAVRSIVNDYDSSGVVSSVSFSIEVNGRLLQFLLPARIDRVYKAIQEMPEIPRSKRTREQAARIAWRVIYYWIETNLSMLMIDCVDLAEIFLPYNIMNNGLTAYETIINRDQKLLDE